LQQGSVRGNLGLPSTRAIRPTPEVTMKKLLLGLILLLIGTGIWAVTAWQLSYQPLDIDLTEHYADQDRTVTGKAGVLFTGLMMPEFLDDQPDLFLHLSSKPARSWPWPFSLLTEEDHPTVLLDARRFHEQEEFTPARLIDAWGRDRDADGTPYIEKYRAGSLRWVPPRERLGSGHFLDELARSSWPASAQKSTVNARLWYYGIGLNPPGMPHAAGLRHVVGLASERLQADFPELEIRHVNAPISEEVRRGVFELLDSGVETLILASTQTSHSTFKVLGEGASYYEAWRFAEEWRSRNGNPPLRIIMADPMGHFQPMLDAFVLMLRDRLDTLPPGTDVDVLISSHGMPWDRFPDETYPHFAAPYYAGLRSDIEALLATYEFGRTRISQGQDLFADEQYDPEDRYVSTNEAYRAAVADGYDIIITLPSTFYAESTDTLFAHALYAFEGVPGYDPFATIENTDWTVPFVREFTMGDTLIVYNGLPVGPYATHVADALAATVRAILAP